MQTLSLIIFSVLFYFCSDYVTGLLVRDDGAHSFDTLSTLPNSKLNSVWEAIPVIEPPTNTSALAAARSQIFASIKGTCLDPFNATSCLPKGSVQTNAVSDLVCETSRGSPDWVDAFALATWVKRRGRIACPQLAGQICTAVSQWGTAGIGICSTPKIYKFDCFTVGTVALLIAESCVGVSGGVRRVGGKYVIDYNPAYDSVINLFRSH